VFSEVLPTGRHFFQVFSQIHRFAAGQPPPKNELNELIELTELIQGTRVWHTRKKSSRNEMIWGDADIGEIINANTGNNN
jgi:hypothetical protein